MTFNQEKIYKWIAGTGIFLMCVSLFFTTKLVHMNSDNTWYAMMGRSIAEGNILLSNFIEGNSSHYFPYATIEAFWSLFVHNYRDVHALSIVTLVALSGGVLFFAIKGLLGKKVRLFSVLTLIAIVITIHPGTLTDTFAHTAPLLCTLSAACLYYTKRDEQWAKYGIVTLLACWIDNYNIAYFLAPIIVENILYYKKTKKIDPMLKWVAFGIVVYIIRHMALKDVGIVNPGGEKSIIRSALTAAHFAGISNRFSQVYLSFANLFSAGFWGLRIEKALWNLYFAIAMFFALYLQCRYLIEIFKRKSNDENRFMTFLLLGSIFILGLQLFSQMHIVPRYLSGLFVNSLVILGYWLNIKWPVNKKLCVIFIITFVVSIACQISQSRHKMDWALKERLEIARIIRAENLSNGYAWYGNGSSTNFVMNEQRVATIGPKSKEPMSFAIDKSVFYRPGKFDFVIAWKNNQGDWGNHDWNDQEIQENFGKPKKIIDSGRVRLYIYEDITDKVDKPDQKLGFSHWEGTRRWTDGEKAQVVVEKNKKLVSFNLIGRAPSMKSIKVFFNGKLIQTMDMAAIKNGDLVKIPLPQSDVQHNLLLLELDKPSRPIDWTQGKNQDKRLLGILTENWKVE